jgi:hypothetical protein
MCDDCWNGGKPAMHFSKGDRVAFTTRGFRLEGTVVRTRRSDGMVTVNAPAVYVLGGMPTLDTREEMYWDVPPTALSQVEVTK